ncbi:MAG: hypothetical protein ACOH17_09335 [Cellulomonas sp.]
MSPPDNEIPCAAALSAVLARTDDVAVGLDGATVFSTGIMLRIVVRRRRDHEPDRSEDLHTLVQGGGRRGDGRQLMLGVELADGRRAAALGDPWFRHLSEDGSLDVALISQGAGGGGRTSDASYWLTVVPPAGDLKVVCAWPVFAIPETVTVVDAGPLAEAVARVVELWPVQPATPYEPITPVGPVVAPGGWFEQVLSTSPSSAGPVV